MEEQLRAILDEFQRQWTTDHGTADRSLLERGKQLVDHVLESDRLDPGTARAGFDVHGWLGDLGANVRLLRRYLSAESLPIAEEAWARWHLTDCLAMRRECEEAVQNQQAYLDWARRILPQPGWMLRPKWPFGDDANRNRTDTPADECLLIRLMYDATQAFCWDEIGKADEWMRIFNEIMASTPATPSNRPDRRYYLRTASALMKKARRPQDSLQLAERLRALIDEDPTWDEALEVEIDAMCQRIDAYGHLGETAQARRTGAEATALLETAYRDGAPLPPEILRMLYHNTAASLYAAQQYDLAIPLFRRTMDMKTLDAYAHLWLAASLWASTRDKAQVLPLLEEARSLRMGDPLPLVKAPEFRDVAEDEGFRGLFSWATR